jgi:iron(III) transport system permease protein
MIYLAGALLRPDWALWEHMLDTFLPQMLQNTLMLVLGVGIMTGLLGSGLAWLVTAYEFPLRRFWEQALLLPLAVPTFIMGFVFVGLFEFAGPVQQQWRAWFGPEAPFPDIRSSWGAILVMSLVLYPYVYLLARAGFREQSASTYEAARVMGYSRRQTFFRLVLPLARPSLVAGMTLAMMEALTDFGTVRFFNYPTLTEGIVRVWQVRFDQDSATQLAALLLFIAVAMMLLEQLLRGQARYYQQGGCKGRRMERFPLQGFKKWLAFILCAGVFGLAFVLPAMQLGAWAYQEMQQPSVGEWQSVYQEYVENSMRLAGIAALAVSFFAVLAAHGLGRGGAMDRSAWLPRLASRFLTLGYAIPGAVIAVGVLTLLAPIDHQVTDWVEEHLGRTDRSLIFTGTMTGLIYAYTVRFMAVSFNSVEASLSKITPSMEQAARTLGARPWRVLWRIHLPLLSGGLTTGMILVFVDVMKELPTTILLRPFGMDTLALWSYFLASESFWQAAAIPALSIVVVGLLPVFLLMRLGGSD